MLDRLRQDGIVVSPNKMFDSELFDLHVHLNTCQVWNAHVVPHATLPPQPLPVIKAEGQWPAFSHSMEDIIRAPHIFECILQGLDFAWEYFGERPRLYSMNAFWTQPAQARYEETHEWHRDGDDRKQLCTFIYGTDIWCVADGPHGYQRRTHRIADGSLDKVFNDAKRPVAGLLTEAHSALDRATGYDYLHPPESVVETIYGKAGTIFFTDPNGRHVGHRPSTKPRLLIWGRWGVSDPPEAYKWDHLKPVPKEVLGNRYPVDPVLQDIVRLVVS